MIDLHSHLLHDLDDGPRALAASVSIARAMAADGVTSVAATPHVRDDWPGVTPAARDTRLRELRAALAAEEVALDVLPGGEIALDALPRLTAVERAAFGLGGNPAVLLLEFPYWGWPLQLGDTVFQLVLEGITPVLAHPERNLEVQDAPERLEPAVRAGALVQLTAASVDGRIGRGAQGTCRRLLDLGLAHVIASDAHTAEVRAAGLSRAAAAVGGGLGRWLTLDVPGALLAGEPLPPRPGGRRRLGLRR